MKKSLKIVLIVAISFFLLSMLKDQIIKTMVTAVASQITGTKVKIQGFSLGIIKQAVRIKGCKAYNPEGFPAGVMVDLAQIYVDSDLSAILKGKLHLEEVSVDLKELILVKNKEGRLNVDSLKIVQGENKEPQGKKAAQPMPMQIDSLKLKMGRVISKDYRASGEPVILVYNINLQKTYNNITSARQLAALILTEPMKAAGIRGAAIYGVSALAGVAILPVAAAVTFAGKDYAEENLSVSFEKLYDASIKVLKRIGTVTNENKADGLISAQVNGASISVNLKKFSWRNTQARVSAREFLFPKPEIAAGILYQISEAAK